MSEGFSFEGEDVTNFVAQLPSAKLEAPEAYPRGTVMTLAVQVRVRSVRIDTDKHDNLTRNHILAIDDVQITDVLTPARRQELLELAEKAAQSKLDDFTVQEEVVPGQTTIEDHLEDPEDAPPGEHPEMPVDEVVALANKYAKETYDQLEEDKFGNADARGYAAQSVFRQTLEAHNVSYDDYVHDLKAALDPGF